MSNETFRFANSTEHEIILNSEKTVFWTRLLFFALLALMFLGGLSAFVLKMNKSTNEISNEREEADFLLGFNETEETVIKELYGDLDEKVESLVWENKSQFIDKEKTTATGTITYNEPAMESYRKQKLEELKSQIDYQKVQTILEERKSEYQKHQKSQSRSGKEKVSSENVKLLFLGAIYALVLAVAAYFGRKRYQCIVDQDYLITDAVINKKQLNIRRDILPRRIIVNYAGGTEEVVVTALQTLSMHVGDQVYLMKLNTGYRPYKLCKK